MDPDASADHQRLRGMIAAAVGRISTPDTDKA
jgi:hypothetical protein